MMELEQGIRRIQKEWETRTDDTSALARPLTGSTRDAWRLARKLPVQCMVDVLDGIQITTDEETVPAGTGTPAPSVSWPLALLVIVPCAVGAALTSWLTPSFLIVGIVTLVVAAVTSLLALWLSGRRRKPEPAVRKQPVPRVTLEEETVDSALEEAQAALQDLLDYLSRQEADAHLGYDISGDRSFGEWVQKFVNYANRCEDNHTLSGLKGELLLKLSRMGIGVYDELEWDENGVLILPEAAYFKDSRTGSAYTKVVKAAVYSRRGLMAKGELA